MTKKKTTRNAIELAVGRMKEMTGKATGNSRLAAEGRGEQVKSRVKHIGERVKNVFEK